MPQSLLQTRRISTQLREQCVDLGARKIRLANLQGSSQEHDLTKPANCRGFGRIHHFRTEAKTGWPENLLPNAPAARALGGPIPKELQVQLFQIAACNWHCWYCFVDDGLRRASPAKSSLLSVPDILDLYEEDSGLPRVIVLSGGHPDLVPEWVPWMMEELRARGLQDTTYLWSDDNLSTQFFWSSLSDIDRQLIQSYRNYGRVCCLKGFDEESFCFNTSASQDQYDLQFQFLRKLLDLGIDIYCYVTLTCENVGHLDQAMARFVDRLQAQRENLPLRTVPLEIKPIFAPIKDRLGLVPGQSLENQKTAVACWNNELAKRFSTKDREMSIETVPL